MVYGVDRKGQPFRLNFKKAKDASDIDSFIELLIDLLVEHPHLAIDGHDLNLLGASLRALVELEEAGKIPYKEEMH